MSSRFYFQVFNSSNQLVAVHDVPDYLAQSESEAWQAFGMGLADYPKSYKVVLQDSGSSEVANSEESES